MSLADKFHSHRGAALALSTLLAVTSVAAPFQNASAQEPANHPVATKVVAANNNGTQEQLGPLAKAAKYSNEEGIAFYFVQGSNDNNDYMPLLKSLRQTMTLDSIPSKVFGVQSTRPGTYLVFFAKGVTYTGMATDALKSGQLDGYKPDDIRNGRVSFEAKRAYQQAFLGQHAKVAATDTTATSLVANREP